MRRPLLVAGGLSLLLVAGLVAAALLSEPAPTTDAQRAVRIAGQLRCPDCEALSVAESRTRAADAIRGEIETLVAAGRTDAEVRDHFVERYGEWILLAPEDPLAWWLPLGAVLAGILLFGAWVWSGRSRGAPPPPSRPMDPASRRRVSDELEALDG
jgi:cytochrome c-type biogenesis protein CcmH